MAGFTQVCESSWDVGRVQLLVQHSLSFSLINASLPDQILSGCWDFRQNLQFPWGCNAILHTVWNPGESKESIIPLKGDISWQHVPRRRYKSTGLDQASAGSLLSKLRERRGKKLEKPNWLHLGASLLRSLPHQNQTTFSPGFSFWVPGLEITLNRHISSPGCASLCHYVVQGALRQPEPGVLRDGWKLCPRWSWQPLWLEIAVQCKGSHLTVFAPYHFQRISALETIGALSCLSSSSTFYLKHIWVLVLRKQLKGAHHKKYYLWGAVSSIPLSVCYS